MSYPCKGRTTVQTPAIDSAELAFERCYGIPPPPLANLLADPRLSTRLTKYTATKEQFQRCRLDGSHAMRLTKL